MTIEQEFDAAEPAAPTRARGAFAAFLADVEPFFYQVPITYVEIGAHRGDAFRDVADSGLRLLDAHLVEPNPGTFAALEQGVATSPAADRTTCHRLAIADAPGRLLLRERGRMTRVISPPGPGARDAAATFEIESTTLDALAAHVAASRISILKIDVEGYEAQVLAGAARLLAAQAIDMIHIGAGMDPGGNQQTYYRDIEDVLRGHGYRLFRIYEQVHEWTEDSPLLRRVNLAFMSDAFGRRHPFRLSRELMALRKDRQALQDALMTESGRKQEAEARIAELTGIVERQEAELAAAREESGTHGARIDPRVDELANLTARLERQHQEIARLRAERNALAAKAASAGGERRHRDGSLAATELAKLRIYTKRLEKAHMRMLDSRSWRVMEPLRRMMRALKGGSPPQPFTPRLLAGKNARDPR